jgi:hypothetical protein
VVGGVGGGLAGNRDQERGMARSLHFSVHVFCLSPLMGATTSGVLPVPSEIRSSGGLEGTPDVVTTACVYAIVASKLCRSHFQVAVVVHRCRAALVYRDSSKCSKRYQTVVRSSTRSYIETN